MDKRKNLKVFDTPAQMFEDAFRFTVNLSKAAIKERGRFVIALSGGNTPVSLYKLFAEPALEEGIDWKNTFVFWGDERFVTQNDERNNAHQARTLFLDKVGIPPVNIFSIPVKLSSPTEAAQEYEQTLTQFFDGSPPRFDLILLGLGDNGHTASLFPNTEVLHEKKHWVKEVYVEEQKMFRITMTAPFINQARNIMFLVTGKEKSSILKAIIDGSAQPDKYPAQLIVPDNGELYWFVDRDAASCLT